MAQADLADEEARVGDLDHCIVGRPSYHEHLFSQLRAAMPVLVTTLEATPDESIQSLLDTFDDWSDGRGRVARAWGSLLLGTEQRRQGCPMLVAYVNEQNELSRLEHFGCDDAGEESLPKTTRELFEPILAHLAAEQRVAPLFDAVEAACAPRAHANAPRASPSSHSMLA